MEIYKRENQVTLRGQFSFSSMGMRIREYMTEINSDVISNLKSLMELDKFNGIPLDMKSVDWIKIQKLLYNLKQL